MKIDKTEREFRESVNRAAVGLRHPVEDSVPLADALKDALDLEFKEEEPKNPCPYCGAALPPHHHYKGPCPQCPPGSMRTKDPEEPELPARVRVRNRITGDGADLLPEDGPWESREQGIAGVRELAARYNALPRILELLDRSAERCLDDGKTTNGIALRAEARAILADERERLQ